MGFDRLQLEHEDAVSGAESCVAGTHSYFWGRHLVHSVDLIVGDPDRASWLVAPPQYVGAQHVMDLVRTFEGPDHADPQSDGTGLSDRSPTEAGMRLQVHLKMDSSLQS